ncbi:transposase [Pseudonocardia sp. Cha107L01]|uniref:transposase n=1 Tax=Pseudonocardia sp. Cha107L01 TaxID=3457576 RepID=UPI00403E81DC
MGPYGRVLTMSRTGPPRSRLSAQEKTQIVLAVLAGEMTLAEAARRHGVTPQAVGHWRGRFLEAGKASLESRMPGVADGAGSQPERRLRAEAEQLKLALAEATVQLPIWRKGTEHVDAFPLRKNPRAHVRGAADRALQKVQLHGVADPRTHQSASGVVHAS